MKQKPISKAHYPRFFAAWKKACDALNLQSDREREEYRLHVLAECAGCGGLQQLCGEAKFDACLSRFAEDAGDFEGATRSALMGEKRAAYVANVMATQILQLKGLGPHFGRNYIVAILDRAHVSVGWVAGGANFWMDIKPENMRFVIRVLDTHLRRLKRRFFPTTSVTFSDRVAFSVDGPIVTREAVPKDFYTHLFKGASN